MVKYEIVSDNTELSSQEMECSAKALPRTIDA